MRTYREMIITVKPRGRTWLTFIFIAGIGLAGCTGEKVDQTENTESVFDRFSESGDGVEKEALVLASTNGNEEEGDLNTSEGREPQAPSLIYTREYYSYMTRKTKDPFQPLLQEGGEMEGLTLNALTLTGILWDKESSMAVMEDSRGRGYMMKVGDKIAGANLVAIRRDAAVFRVVEFGVIHNVVKELFVKEELPI